MKESFSDINSIKRFDYTPIPHVKLKKQRLQVIVHKAFQYIKRYQTSIDLEYNTTYILFTLHKISKHATTRNMLSICCRFLVTIYLSNLEEYFFNKLVGISYGTNCSPFLANLFLFSFELEFLTHLSKTRRPNTTDHLSLHSDI